VAGRLLGALGSTSALLGGEGARVISQRLRDLRVELADRLGDELATITAQGARGPLEELAAAVG
jgi:hypothetical protein